MKTLKEIKSILHDHSEELYERYGITNIAVFGSVVRGEVEEGSDIDILADVPLRLNLFDLMEVELYLSIKRTLSFKVWLTWVFLRKMRGNSRMMDAGKR